VKKRKDQSAKRKKDQSAKCKDEQGKQIFAFCALIFALNSYYRSFIGM